MSGRLMIILVENQRARLLKNLANADFRGFSYEGTVYSRCHDSSVENNFGFYDWLRNADEDFLGIRLGFLDRVPPWLRALDLSDCAIDERKRLVSMFFEESQAIDEGISDDALLGDVCVFIGNNKEVALSCVVL